MEHNKIVKKRKPMGSVSAYDHSTLGLIHIQSPLHTTLSCTSAVYACAVHRQRIRC